MTHDEIIDTMAQGIAAFLGENDYSKLNTVGKNSFRDLVEPGLDAIYAKGLMLAPQLPTEEMKDAGIRVLLQYQAVGSNAVVEIYRAMTAAAVQSPAHPTQEPHP